MDLNGILVEASKIRNASAEMQKLITRVNNGKIEGENLTATQKNNIKQKGIDELQNIKDAVTAIDNEIGA